MPPVTGLAILVPVGRVAQRQLGVDPEPAREPDRLEQHLPHRRLGLVARLALGRGAALGLGAAQRLARVEQAREVLRDVGERVVGAAALDLALDPIPVASTSRLFGSASPRALGLALLEDVRVAADQLLGDLRRRPRPSEPAPRSSSSSERKTTWKSTSPSSSRSFASSPRAAASASS